MENKELYLTPEGAEKLRNELEDLINEERPKLAQRLRHAVEMGDLSENADYIKAKEDQAFLEGRIQELFEFNVLELCCAYPFLCSNSCMKATSFSTPSRGKAL